MVIWVFLDFFHLHLQIQSKVKSLQTLPTKIFLIEFLITDKHTAIQGQASSKFEDNFFFHLVPPIPNIPLISLAFDPTSIPSVPTPFYS